MPPVDLNEASSKVALKFREAVNGAMTRRERDWEAAAKVALVRANLDQA